MQGSGSFIVAKLELWICSASGTVYVVVVLVSVKNQWIKILVLTWKWSDQNISEKPLYKSVSDIFPRPLFFPPDKNNKVEYRPYVPREESDKTTDSIILDSIFNMVLETQVQLLFHNTLSSPLKNVQSANNIIITHPKWSVKQFQIGKILFCG